MFTRLGVTLKYVSCSLRVAFMWHSGERPNWAREIIIKLNVPDKSVVDTLVGHRRWVILQNFVLDRHRTESAEDTVKA